MKHKHAARFALPEKGNENPFSRKAGGRGDSGDFFGDVDGVLICYKRCHAIKGRPDTLKGRDAATRERTKGKGCGAAHKISPAPRVYGVCSPVSGGDDSGKSLDFGVLTSD